MAVAAIPQYASTSKTFRLGQVNLAAGQNSMLSATGARYGTTLQKLPVYPNGASVVVGGFSLRRDADVTCSRIDGVLYSITVASGKTPSSSGAELTRESSSLITSTPWTGTSNYTATGWTLGFTYDSTKVYYFGVGLYAASGTGRAQVYASAVASYGKRYYSWTGSGLSATPATLGTCDLGIGWEPIWSFTLTSTADAVDTVADLDASGSPKYLLPVCTTADRYGYVFIKGAKTGGTTPLVYTFRHVNEAGDGWTNDLFLSLTTDGASSKLVLSNDLGNSFEATLEPASASGDYWDIVLQYNTSDTSLSEVFFRNRTGRGTALSTYDYQWKCLGLLSGDGAYQTYAGNGGSANSLLVTGGSGSRTGIITCGCGLWGTLGDSMLAEGNHLDAAIIGAFQTHYDALVVGAMSSCQLVNDTAAQTNALDRFLGDATVNHLQYIRDITWIVGPVGYNDWANLGLFTDASAQKKALAMLDHIGQIVTAIRTCSSLNNLIVVAPFKTQVSLDSIEEPAGGILREWYRRYADGLLSLGREARFCVHDAYRQVLPFVPATYMDGPGVHLNAAGAALVGERVASVLTAGYAPAAVSSDSSPRFSRF